MNVEFHYYITYIVSRRSGFSPEEASIIAYSSWHVDKNLAVYDINQGSPDAYSNYISQTMSIGKPQKELMRIYPVFHLLPGSLDEITCDSARRTDGKLHLLNTIPDSKNSRLVLSEALTSGDRYRIGIATHTYADTFAHQNFAGTYDSFNAMPGVLESVVPTIAHLHAGQKPDRPNETWEDRRLVPSHATIDNKERFLAAAGCLYDYYCDYLGTVKDKGALLADIAAAIGDGSSDEASRMAHYRTLIGGELDDYKQDKWFEEAIDFEIVHSLPPGSYVPMTERRWIWRDNYKTSHWFCFQEAVKAHQHYVLDTIVRPIYERMEQTNW